MSMSSSMPAENTENLLSRIPNPAEEAESGAPGRLCVTGLSVREKTDRKCFDSSLYHPIAAGLAPQ